MALRLNLPPELEQYLIQEAHQQGLSVEAVALHLLSNPFGQKKRDASKKRDLIFFKRYLLKKMAVNKRTQELNAAVNLLQSWIDDEDDQEQKETGQYLVQALDEDRLSDRKLFPLKLKGITW